MHSLNQASNQMEINSQTPSAIFIRQTIFPFILLQFYYFYLHWLRNAGKSETHSWRYAREYKRFFSSLSFCVCYVWMDCATAQCTPCTHTLETDGNDGRWRRRVLINSHTHYHVVFCHLILSIYRLNASHTRFIFPFGSVSLSHSVSLIRTFELNFTLGSNHWISFLQLQRTKHSTWICDDDPHIIFFRSLISQSVTVVFLLSLSLSLLSFGCSFHFRHEMSTIFALFTIVYITEHGFFSSAADSVLIMDAKGDRDDTAIMLELCSHITRRHKSTS